MAAGTANGSWELEVCTTESLGTPRRLPVAASFIPSKARANTFSSCAPHFDVRSATGKSLSETIVLKPEETRYACMLVKLASPP